jgi:hypothetical protein
MTDNNGKAELLQRLMTDADFRRRLLSDPEGVIAAEGYIIDPAVIDQLKSLDVAAAEAAIAQLGSEASREAAG